MVNPVSFSSEQLAEIDRLIAARAADPRIALPCTPRNHSYSYDGKEKQTYQCLTCGKAWMKGPGGTMLAIPGGGAPNIITRTAAQLALGENFLAARPDLIYAGYPRTITRAGISGSAAAGDLEVEIRVGGVPVATLKNLATGAINLETGAPRMEKPIPVPASFPLEVRVMDAASTNDGFLYLDV